MTRYKHAEFADEDNSSLGSVHLNETTTSPKMHIRYHTARTASLWRARTRTEQCLIVALSVCFGAFAAAAIGWLCTYRSLNTASTTTRILHVQPPPPAVGHETCLTEQCIHTASDMLRSMDSSVNPCDDFYAFACNRWIQENPIPDGKSTWGTFGKLEQRNQLVIKNVLERPIESFKSKAEKKAKLYYESCLDEDETMELLGAEPLQTLLRQVGGWNVTESGYNHSAWRLGSSMKVLQNRYNIGGFFGWMVGEDDRNSSRYIVQIDQGGLSLPTREHYLNRTAHAKVLDAYLDYMVRVAVLLGGNRTEAHVQLEQVVTFETRLAEITTPQDERRDEELIYHLMTVRELQQRAPFLDWQDHLDDAFRKVKRKITDRERVVVYAPEYLEKLNGIVVEYNQTQAGQITLNNYMIWQLVRTFTACLSKPFREAYKGLRKALVGTEGGEEPWRYCVNDASNVIGFAIGAMFVREVFHGEAKPQSEQMISEIRSAFQDNLRQLRWMDAETRQLAVEKADAITDMIGFPDYILNAAQLDEKYRDLDLDPKKYFENNIRVNQYNLLRNLERLDQPVNKTMWSMTPPTVNAYYTPAKNQIVFPAGILQAPFYDARNAKSLNFGGMGVVMGHELTHAFDDQGREFDKEGNLHQWWNNRTVERFKERTACLAKQYGEYRINGKPLNGKQTVGENIADNGGLKAAYRAFVRVQDLSATAADVQPLPGLNMTHRQLFFLSFAQVWCSATTDETINLQIEKDAHAPSRFRVIGPLSNLPEFSDVFRCPLGSPMNPADKCEIW